MTLEMSTFTSRYTPARLKIYLMKANVDPRQHACTADEIYSQAMRSTGMVFTLDAAADSDNHRCSRWFGPGGLHPNFHEPSWRGETVFLNPPFVLGGLAVEKALHEWVEHRVPSTLLINAKTANKSFEDAVRYGVSVGLFGTRVAYLPGPGVQFSDPNLDSMLLVFNGMGKVFYAGEGNPRRRIAKPEKKKRPPPVDDGRIIKRPGAYKPVMPRKAP